MRLFFLLFLLPAAQVSAQPLQQISPYFVGHSLVNLDVPAMIKSLATDAGKTDQYAYQIGIGANLWWQWDTLQGNEQGILWQKALPTGQFDAMVITEAVPLMGHLLWSRTDDFADSFLLTARKYRPDIRFFIYETWHCNTTGTPTGCAWDNNDNLLWRPRLAADFPLWTGIMDTLKKRNPDSKVWMVPAGQAFGMLADSIAAGKVPGIADVKTLFTDDIHLTHVGNYFVACVMYACLFRESPEGRTNQTFSEWGTPFTAPTPALAKKMQQIAWKTVTNLAARTGVSASSVATQAPNDGLVLQIFPNPSTQGEAIVVFSESDFKALQVVDIQGKIVFNLSLAATKNCRFDLPQAGVYLLRVRMADGKVVLKKLVVRNG